MVMNRTVAAIFDMDGVLVDSYRAHFESWQIALATRGRSMSQQQFVASFGRTSREVIAHFWPDMAENEHEIARLDAHKEEAFRKILAADFPAMPGIQGLIESLFESGCAIAIGTSGPPENAELTLDRLRIRPLLGAIVTGSDVTRGKPDPQVFLLAAQRLGVPPQRCVVVEDAPLGIAAAKAGGMRSVGFASTGRNRAMLAAADLVVQRFDDLKSASLRALAAGHD